MEGVGAVGPGLAGLAQEGGDAAAGGLGQEVGEVLVEPADGFDVVGARRGALLDQADPPLLEQRAEHGDEPLGGLEVLEHVALRLADPPERLARGRAQLGGAGGVDGADVLGELEEEVEGAAELREGVGLPEVGADLVQLAAQAAEPCGQLLLERAGSRAGATRCSRASRARAGRRSPAAR